MTRRSATNRRGAGDRSAGDLMLDNSKLEFRNSKQRTTDENLEFPCVWVTAIDSGEEREDL
jgi:hypothetical protein